MFACTLPFAALFMAFGVPTVHGFVQLMIFLVAIAWVFHGLALLNSLIMKGQRNARGAVGVVVFFVLDLLHCDADGADGPIHPVHGALRRGRPADVFRFTRYPGWRWCSCMWRPSCFSSYLAARRKMGSERIHPLTKPQAIAALASLAVSVAGWDLAQRETTWFRKSSCSICWLITAILLILMVTPNRAEYFKGLWRANKQGAAGPPWWDDLHSTGCFW